MGQPNPVAVLDKAVAILRAVADEPASLAELVERTGLPRATAHRLAVGLEVHGLLTRDAGGRLVARARSWPCSPPVPPSPLVLACAGRAPPAAGPHRRERPGLPGGRAVPGVRRRRRASTGLRDTVPLGSRLPMTAGSGAQVSLAVAAALQRARLLAAPGFTEARPGRGAPPRLGAIVAEREAGRRRALGAGARRRPGACRLAAVSVSGPVERIGGGPAPRSVERGARGRRRDLPRRPPLRPALSVAG